MTRAEQKEAAQSDIMRGIIARIETIEENEEKSPEHIQEMIIQAKRVMKLFGYESFGWLKMEDK